MSEESEMDKQQYINIIVNQTNYTEEQATELFIKYEGDYMSVIKDYLTGDCKKENKQKVKKSINQEIYKHIRGKMNENMDVVIARMNGNI